MCVNSQALCGAVQREELVQMCGGTDTVFNVLSKACRARTCGYSRPLLGPSAGVRALWVTYKLQSAARRRAQRKARSCLKPVVPLAQARRVSGVDRARPYHVGEHVVPVSYTLQPVLGRPCVENEARAWQVAQQGLQKIHLRAGTRRPARSPPERTRRSRRRPTSVPRSHPS